MRILFVGDDPVAIPVVVGVLTGARPAVLHIDASVGVSVEQADADELDYRAGVDLLVVDLDADTATIVVSRLRRSRPRLPVMSLKPGIDWSTLPPGPSVDMPKYVSRNEMLAVVDRVGLSPVG